MKPKARITTPIIIPVSVAMVANAIEHGRQAGPPVALPFKAAGPKSAPGKLTSKLKLAFGILAVVAVLAALKLFHAGQRLQSVLRWVQGMGGWAPVVFILIYIAACVLFLPGSLLTLGAGALFGLVHGTLIVSIASTLGATSAFLTGRYLARDWVIKKVEQSPKFKAINEAVAAEGWKIVGLLRLSPVFPFSLLNYALGLTRVSLRDYFFASWAGMLPGTVVYVYVGSVIGDLGKLGEEGRAKAPLEWAFYAAGLLATVMVTIYVARLARKALAERIGV